VWQEITNPRAALAALREPIFARSDRQPRLPAHHSSNALPHAHGSRKLLIEMLLQCRLVIEQLKLRRTAGLEEEDDSLRRGREMRRDRSTRIGAARQTAKQLSERQRAHPERRAHEEISAIQQRRQIHGLVARDRFIEIEDNAGDIRVRGKFRVIE
jgi:hypothetical protein